MFGLARNLWRWSRRRMQRSATVAIVGLDGAGKSTLFSVWEGTTDLATAPTIGFNSSVLRRNGWTISMYDVGGGASLRGIWPQYFADVHAIVFVVDAGNTGRFAEAADTLHAVLEHPLNAGKPVVVCANKQDLPDASTCEAVASALRLSGDTNSGLVRVRSIQANIPAALDNTDAWRVLDELMTRVASGGAALTKQVALASAEQKRIQAIEKQERRARVAAQREERRRLAEATEAAAVVSLAAASTVDEAGVETTLSLPGSVPDAAADAPGEDAASQQEPAVAPVPESQEEMQTGDADGEAVGDKLAREMALPSSSAPVSPVAESQAATLAA